MSTPLIFGFVVVIALVGLVAFRWGRSGRREQEGKRLEEYDFYPFRVNDDRQVEFDPERFKRAVDHFQAHRNTRAAWELIVIAEQSLVRDRFDTDSLDAYRRLYESYDGDSVISDNEAYLENYKRIVEMLGRSFPNTGIEILLHNLVNPGRSIVAIESGAVTGRKLGMGATNLVLDLKTRSYHGQDKLNYELTIGARRFKCTTIPIFRRDYGLVGAICINIDANFVREAVATSPERMEAFVQNLLRTEMELEENILSPDEYQAALRGKRHYLDEPIRGGYDTPRSTGLSAIVFSDIVDFTATMARDEQAALAILATATGIQRQAVAAHRGVLLKELGDGILASFGSVSNAVAAAQEIQRAVGEAGTFRLRIAIHLGEVIRTGADVFGDGVNLASRLLHAAQPGGIVVSQAVFENVRNKGGVVVEPLGERVIRGLDEPVRVYAIADDTTAPPDAPVMTTR